MLKIFSLYRKNFSINLKDSISKNNLPLVLMGVIRT